jgi:hypothetical protein
MEGERFLEEDTLHDRGLHWEANNKFRCLKECIEVKYIEER